MGALLGVFLLIAETFAVAHPYDSAAHADGLPCAVCVAAASFSAGAVAESPQLAVDPATLVVVLVAPTILIAAVPTRRYARGPPSTSFTF